MWLRRTKSRIRVHNNSPDFSCSTFKDVQSLCANENENCNLSSPVSSRKASNIFHRVRSANAVLRAFSDPQQPGSPFVERKVLPPETFDSFVKDAILDAKLKPKKSDNVAPTDNVANDVSIHLPGAEKRIVIYFTSLRVVRSTFEHCKAVRSILRAFRVAIDERDLSMDSGFMAELQRILGMNEKSKLTLPRVFIGGRYIGGAEEVSKLHEAGELKKYVEGLSPADPGSCEVCGGYRFILCGECNGSRKCYGEKGGFRTCTVCNENGLVRCPSCSSAPL